jgi:hypothetical protein
MVEKIATDLHGLTRIKKEKQSVRIHAIRGKKTKPQAWRQASIIHVPEFR